MKTFEMKDSYRSILIALVSFFLFGTFTFSGVRASGYDALLFRPAGGPHHFTVTESNFLLDRYQFYVGSIASYAHSPLQVVQANQSSQRILGHILSQHFLFSMALHERYFQLDVDLPLGWEVEFRDPQVTPSPKKKGIQSMDIKVQSKTVFARSENTSWGFSPFFTLPTGNSDQYLGADSFTGGARILFDAHLTPVYQLSANMGALFRNSFHFRNLRQGNQGLYSLGVSAKWDPRFSMSTELYGRTRLSSPFNQRAENPCEWLATVHFKFPESQLDLTMGGGIGLIRGTSAAKGRGYISLGLAI